MKYTLEASLFSSNLKNIAQEINRLSNTKINCIHFDVMDNVFVKNIALSTKEYNLLDLKRFTINVHLMVTDPIKYINIFKIYNPQTIIFHIEAKSHKENLQIIDYIKKLGIKAGIAIKPKTNFSDYIDEILNSDFVLIMSVEPGFGGQKFIPETIERLQILKNIIKDKNIIIGIDGGINLDNIKSASKIAASIVVGSSLFFAPDINERAKEFEKLLNI